MKDLAKKDIEWLERHLFMLTDDSSCYKRSVGGKYLSIYYSPTYRCMGCFCFESNLFHGEGKTAEDAFLDLLKKNKAYIEELQNFQNELAKI